MGISRLHSVFTNFAIVCLLAVSTVPALGQEGRWNLGASAGRARTSDQWAPDRLQALGYYGEQVLQFDSDDAAWKAHVGFAPSDFVAIEAVYADFGHTDLTTNHFLASGSNLTSEDHWSRHVRAYGLDTVIRAPLTEQLSFFARVGVARAIVDLNVRGGDALLASLGIGGHFRASSRNAVRKIGIGGDWRISPALAIRVEWERYRGMGTSSTGKTDEDLISGGLNYTF